ncbi:GGDEF domain-containing protein [Starkeya koreensis]|uniref:diguanylate cyclase n=1 Tax=Ancylobacter koreensis TaxID=266121 RepID=A0ABT0DPM9_9HYPH|nr:sensor domain-containing diguanylate cyclase [Ancylobacter koreensis]MCK0209234.1 GGDEF domain-containing protein [Ancylobacter koreensis]
MLSALSDRELRELYANFPVPTCVIGRDGRYLLVNEELAALVGVPAGQLVGDRAADHFGALADAHIARDFDAFDAGRNVPNHEFAAAGRFYIVASRPVRHAEGGTPFAIHVVLVDITERKLLETQLEHANRHLSEANHKLTEAARTDALTGLWNRHALEELLPWEIARSQREGTPLCVLMVDVDRFKKYNDHYGHLGGDEALRAVAQAMLGAATRPGDMVARYGGEEFLVLLPDTDADGAMKVAANIQRAVAALAIAHEGSPGGLLTLSIGVAGLPARTAAQPPALSPEAVRAALIEEADQALYAAKLEGGNTARLCQPEARLVPR